MRERERDKQIIININQNIDLSTNTIWCACELFAGQRLSKFCNRFSFFVWNFQLTIENSKPRSQCADKPSTVPLHCHIPNCDFIFGSFNFCLVMDLTKFVRVWISCERRRTKKTIALTVSDDSECFYKLDTWVSCVPTFSRTAVHLKFKVVIKITASNERILIALVEREHLSRHTKTAQQNLHLTKVTLTFNTPHARNAWSGNHTGTIAKMRELLGIHFGYVHLIPFNLILFILLLLFFFFAGTRKFRRKNNKSSISVMSP